MNRILILAFFSAMIVVLGLLFLPVPNFEMVTTTCFLAGYFLGPRRGVLAAFIGEFLYSILNPMGAPSPLLLIAQLVGMGTAALTGAFFSSYVSGHKGKERHFPAALQTRLFLALIGLGVTFFYDLLTSASYLLFAGFSFKTFLLSLGSGIFFYVTHIGVNSILFGLLIPQLIPLLQKRIKVETRP